METDIKPVVDPAKQTPSAEKIIADDQNPRIYDADYVKRLRDENKSFREKAESEAKRADELAKFKADREAADLESEKKFKELADLEKKRADDTSKDAAEKVAKAERAAILAEAKAAAIKAGIKDIDDVKLLDLTGVKIEGDEVVGLDAVIAAALEKKPHWFGAEPAKKTEKSGAPPAQKQGETPPKDARDMSPEDFEKIKTKMGLTRRF
jgi:hypothetical protein